MHYLNRLFQTNIYLTQQCTLVCLGCQLNPSDNPLSKHQLNQIKKNQFINIFGGAPQDHPKFIEVLRYIKHRGAMIRLWSNHVIPKKSINDIYPLINEWVIYCPSPYEQEFNQIIGRDGFSRFISVIGQIPTRTLSFTVRPANIEALPDLHELAASATGKAILLYYPKEFNSEELQYIKRYHRVKMVDVIQLNNRPTTTCLAVPNSIDTWGFKFQDWKNQLSIHF